MVFVNVLTLLCRPHCTLCVVPPPLSPSWSDQVARPPWTQSSIVLGQGVWPSGRRCLWWSQLPGLTFRLCSRWPGTCKMLTLTTYCMPYCLLHAGRQLCRWGSVDDRHISDDPAAGSQRSHRCPARWPHLRTGRHHLDNSKYFVLPKRKRNYIQ